jgi:hypothetical protein
MGDERAGEERLTIANDEVPHRLMPVRLLF